jgi:hypothetical protein
VEEGGLLRWGMRVSLVTHQRDDVDSRDGEDGDLERGHLPVAVLDELVQLHHRPTKQPEERVGVVGGTVAARV